MIFACIKKKKKKLKPEYRKSLLTSYMFKKTKKGGVLHILWMKCHIIDQHKLSQLLCIFLIFVFIRICWKEFTGFHTHTKKSKTSFSDLLHDAAFQTFRVFPAFQKRWTSGRFLARWCKHPALVSSGGDLVLYETQSSRWIQVKTPFFLNCIKTNMSGSQSKTKKVEWHKHYRPWSIHCHI